MTEQATPEGSTARPVPDLGFFGAPSAPPPSQYGTPPSQVAPPPNQFGAPPNQFAPPPSQFGNAPVAPFGAGAPAIYASYPAVQKRGGMPGWAIALIAVAAGMFIVMVLAAIAIPVFLNQRAKAVDASTTIVFPASMENLPRQTGPQAESLIQSFLGELPGNSRDSQAGIYSDQSKHQIFVVSTRPPKGSGRLPIDKSIDSFWRGARDGLPVGVTLSVAADRDAGRLGGRMSCATFTGTTNGQICAAADSVVLVSVFDLSPSPDPDLPRRVREAVVHR